MHFELGFDQKINVVRHLFQHHEDLAGAILCVGVTVAEDVLRHEGKAFEELRE